MIYKFSILFFVCTLFSSFLNAQKINQAEFDYLIKPFTTNKSEQNVLQKIHENIVLSDYEAALRLIEKNKQNKKLKPAIWTYLSAIEYVKSNYLGSAALCDSAIALLKTKNGYYIRALNYKAKAISALGDTKNSLKFVESAIRIAKKEKNTYQLGSCYYYLGVFTSEIGNFKKAVDYLVFSKRISRKLKDKINLAATSSFLGLCYSHEGKYSDAIELLNESILIRIEIGDKRGLANSYLNMNKVYTELNDSKKRFEYENKSLQICNEIGDLQCISGRLTNIGDIYFLEGNFKKALNYQKKALAIANKIGINYRIAEIHEHLAEIYNSTNNYKLAIFHIDSSIYLRNLIQENEGISNSLVLKSTILLNQNKVNEALNTANEAMNIAEKFEFVHVIRDGNLILSQIFEKNGSQDNALKSLKKYHFLKDSLLDIDKSKLIIRNDLERKYELNELRNKKIQSEKEHQLQQQKTKTKNIIWIGIVFILSFVIVFYLLFQKYKAQRKINKVVIENQKLNKQIDNLEKRSIFSQTISSIAHELNTPLGVIFTGTKELTNTINRYNQFLLDDSMTTDCIKHIQKWAPLVFKNDNSLISGREIRKNALVIFNLLEEKTNFSNDELNHAASKIAELKLEQNLDDFLDEILRIERPIEFINYLIELKKIKQLENAIDFAVENTKKVVNEMNGLAENQSKFQNFEYFNLYDLLSNLIDQYSELSENQIQTSFEVNPCKKLYFDRISFIQINSIILQNAIEAFEVKQANRTIQINNYTEGSFEIISIENNGPIIPEHEIHTIFNRFYTTKNKSLHRGLGLSTVKSTLEGFGGKIKVKSTEESTVFELYFKIQIPQGINTQKNEN